MIRKTVVSKFGGTSVADYEAMMNCFKIIKNNKEARVIVLSASAKVTNLLLELAQGCNSDKRKELLSKVRLIQFNIINKLNYPENIAEKIESCLNHITSLSEAASLATNDALAAAIVAHGELMSTMIFTHLCLEQGLNAKFLDIRDVIVTDEKFKAATVNTEATLANTFKITDELQASPDVRIITQGFIAREPLEGKTTTLGRGGSDYTAAIIAELIQASKVDIWTDVAGIFTTDPRICPNAKRIDNISFREASEMASFGAKVLHPATIVPAVRSNIPVFIGNSRDPKAGGTWITQEVEKAPQFRGIAFKRNQSIVNIHSLQMLGASGFLANVFNIFSKYGIVIDCVSTSEVAVSVTIDFCQNHNPDCLKNPQLIAELSQLGRVTIEHGLAQVALIGNQLKSCTGFLSMLSVIDNIPIHLICQGACDFSLCVLVPQDQLEISVKLLHQQLFD